MKTAISIPDPIFQAAEEAAKRFSMSRSELYTKAVQDFLAARCPSDITEKLNRVYVEEASQLDSAIMNMQRATIENDLW